jgi:catechol 2,3-dioxygenase
MLARRTSVGVVTSIDPKLHIGAATLAVSDLDRSSDFYERVLGLPVVSREGSEARLGPDADRPALTLEGLTHARPLRPSSTGLYHVAWLHSSRAALAETIRRVLATGWPIEGASDHGVSEAVYLSDPDGLGIEIYADRPRERWERASDGSYRLFTMPLAIEDLLAQGPGDPGPRVAPGTGIGHVHLKVADVPRASAFYGRALGFEQQAALPSAAFLSAGGYHHHVGLNSWQSAGGSPAPDDAPGLRLVRFQLSGPDAIAGVERSVSEDPESAPPLRENGTVLVRDPDGQLLAFSQG